MVINDKTVNLIGLGLAPILILLTLLTTPTIPIAIVWVCLILIGVVLLGLISHNYGTTNIRKNYSIISSSICASVATYFATNGAFPPISLIFTLLFLLQLMAFIDLKKEKREVI